jgi:hypothetical protein
VVSGLRKIPYTKPLDKMVMNCFFRTREHYKQMWYDNQAPNEKYLKIELCWKPEEYEF